MHLGDKRGFICDCCGKNMKYVEKFEVAFKRYVYDETLPIVKSTSHASICAYDFCQNCFETFSPDIKKYNQVRPEHDPVVELKKRHLVKKLKMQKALVEREVI